MEEFVIIEGWESMGFRGEREVLVTYLIDNGDGDALIRKDGKGGEEARAESSIYFHRKLFWAKLGPIWSHSAHR